MPTPTLARPSVLLLDVNETLSDLTPLAGVFDGAGAPPALAQAWLASVLRDGISLACAGTDAAFADIGRDVARRLLAPYTAERSACDAAADRVIETFATLDVHADVPPGLRALADAGVRLVTLSNGAASVAEGLLERAGLADVVERVLSVADAGVWKPAARAYTWACGEVGVDPADAMLAAVHAWDTDGAARAGLGAAWIDRSGSGLGYPAHFTPPTVQATGFDDVADQLTHRR